MTDDSIPVPTRTRHDAFDGRRRSVFLEALGKSGSLRDAARKAGVSHQTVYNHQARDPAFAHACELALHMASTTIELCAWERGVVGVEEPIVHRGEVVGTRLKRSDAILRMLLQGSNRKKYGPNPGFTRRQLHKLERTKIEREVRDEWKAKKGERRATSEETDARLRYLLDKVTERTTRERLADGWTQDGKNWIPPGWVRAAGEPVLPARIDIVHDAAWAEETFDSV